jgi:hypothetical protein
MEWGGGRGEERGGEGRCICWLGGSGSEGGGVFAWLSFAVAGSERGGEEGEPAGLGFAVILPILGGFECIRFSRSVSLFFYGL